MKDKKPIPISERSSKTLAAQVVVFRAFNINENDAIMAMEELQKRKLSGDNFDYNLYIKKQLDALPKPQNNNYSDILKQIIKNAK